ncbi:MAG: filament integrity protein fraC [Leptolyngbya sp.]|nr:MAG: filament integrity protein fraC [Leptolyngbya sp.]
MNFGVLPLRAIAFQGLFLLIAIALEAIVYFRRLGFDYKTSVRYAASVNLFSTFIGWLIFFNLQNLLPPPLKDQLISYFFFERFFQNPWTPGIAPLLALLGLIIFMSVFFLELKSLEILDLLLGKIKIEDTTSSREDTRTSRLRQQGILFKPNSRAYAVLVANAYSFSAILFLLIIRSFEKPR